MCVCILDQLGGFFFEVIMGGIHFRQVHVVDRCQENASPSKEEDVLIC
jgi:hypothetical protein